MQRQRRLLEERIGDLYSDDVELSVMSVECDRLSQLIAQAEERQEALQPRFDLLVDTAECGQTCAIIRQYYGLGLTDSAIADTMDCSVRTVNNRRNLFLRRLPASASADEQKGGIHDKTKANADRQP